MAFLTFVTGGQRDTVNDIMEAVGMGRPYEKKCCPANAQNVTHETPATHFGSMHMGSTPQEEFMLANLAQGILPELVEGEWGENGLPTQQAAQAAISNGSIRYFTGGGWTPQEEEVERNKWLAETLEAAYGGGLQIIPDPPLD